MDVEISSHFIQNAKSNFQKKQRLELFFKMEKSLAQSANESATDVNKSLTGNHIQDETSIAVANLTNLLVNTESLSAETQNSINLNKQVNF